MMNLNKWEHAVRLHLSAIEVLLKNVLDKQYDVSLEEVYTGDNEDAAGQMQQSGKVVRFIETNFQSEIFLNFSEAWVTQLGSHLLADEMKNEKVIDELIIEFSDNLAAMIAGALGEVGINMEITNLEMIGQNDISKAFNLQEYFSAHLHATEADDSVDKDQPFLELRVAASHPDDKTSDSFEKMFSEDNPFDDDRYIEAVNHYAKQVEMKKSEDSSTQETFDSGISAEGKSVEFEDFGKSDSVKNNRDVRNIDILKDVEMDISVELGRREMPLGNILQLVKGSVIELEKLAGEPVEILVNGHKIAQGDVVVIDEHFGVRISNLLATRENLKNLQ